MNALQQMKQLELNVEFPSVYTQRDYSSEAIIAAYLSESPIPPCGTHGVNP